MHISVKCLEAIYLHIVYIYTRCICIYFFYVLYIYIAFYIILYIYIYVYILFPSVYRYFNTIYLDTFICILYAYIFI